MKTLPALRTLVCGLSLIMHSCTSSLHGNGNLADAAPIKEKSAAGASFVEMKDGTVRYFQALQLVTGVFTSPHLLADGHTKISADAIKAYQNAGGYAVSQELLSGGKKSFVAVDALPGFALRIAQGKLNIYAKKYYNGRAAVDEYFVQAGDKGAIVHFSEQAMKSMINDNPSALNFFNQVKEKDLMKKLQATAAIYNREQSMSKN